MIGPDNEVVPDILNRLPGRGIYVSATHAALEKAAGKRLFARAARAPVTVAPDLAATVESLLARRVIELLSLARKAGLAVAGFEKVKACLVDGSAVVLLQAADGSERGKTKLRPPDGPDGFIGVLTAQELGLAFGRESVIHGALAAGELTTRVINEAARLTAVRAQDDGDRSIGKGTTTT